MRTRVRVCVGVFRADCAALAQVSIVCASLMGTLGGLTPERQHRGRGDAVCVLFNLGAMLSGVSKAAICPGWTRAMT